MAKVKTAFLFPGQGSQEVGMAKTLLGDNYFDNLVKKAEEITNRPISRILDGPKEVLDRTSNTQIAVVLVSLGLLAAYHRSRASEKRETSQVDFVAGHSVGELTALAASGAADEEDVIFLANERGLAMEEAGAEHPGGMAAIIGLSDQSVEEITADNDAYVANYNIPDQQIVVSGLKKGVIETGKQAKGKGGLVVPLAVTIPAHTPLMSGAVERVKTAINSIKIVDPVIPIIANRTGRIVTKAEELRDMLPNQLRLPVRWGAGIEFMYDEGVMEYTEVGPSNILKSMVSRHLRGRGVIVRHAQTEI